MDIQVTSGPINTVLIANISRQGDLLSQTRVYSHQDVLTFHTLRSENKPNFRTVGIFKYYGIYKARGRRVGKRSRELPLNGNRIPTIITTRIDTRYCHRSLARWNHAVRSGVH